MEISEIINQLGEERENYFNAVIPPVLQSSNFAFSSVADLREALGNEFKRPIYTRGNNPAVEILRKKIAALEKAEDALVMGSGSAAISCAVLPHVSSGDHVVCVENCYGWTKTLLQSLLHRFGVESTFVDGSDTQKIFDATQDNTTLIYLESPTSFMMELQDLSAIAQFAHAREITTICDNSWASPLVQNPIALGIDLVVHSATKYLNGHSDVVAGVVCGSAEKIQAIFQGEYMTLGPTLSPHDAWLLTRSLRTLPIRMERVQATTREVISFLARDKSIEKIIYPMHESHSQHDLARKQMCGGAGLFSIQLKAHDSEAIERFCDSLTHFLIAVSWGGYESLVIPSIALKEGHGFPENLIRISIGLEDPELLIKDLSQALDTLPN